MEEGQINLEFYRKWRPKRFADVVGQDDVVRSLVEMVKANRVPHAMLASGPSGCGKTTLARILQKKLGCSDMDFVEINAAESRGIDTIREIQQQMPFAPIGGDCRMWLIDECARLTNDSQACLLKMLEDTPSHIYFILATTDPEKLLPTIRTRCTQFKLAPISKSQLKEVVGRVLSKESLEISDAVMDQLVEAADGSARKALVLLHQVAGLETDDERLECIQKSDVRKKAFDIVKALLWERTKWPEMAKILSSVDEDAEGIRRMVLTVASNEMVKGGKNSAWAATIVGYFRDNFYDCGKAGLVEACWQVLENRK